VDEAYLREEQNHRGQEQKQDDLEGDRETPDERGGAIAIE
jgi:hypothetical protein